MLVLEVKVQNIEEFLQLLACPKCHGQLASVKEPEGLLCDSCKLHFAIDDGLPNMLISEAQSWPLAHTPASA
jgi:uncharacterized protein YbaR (Trm112 family)